MNILFIIKKSGLAGVETLIVRIANQLVSQNDTTVHILMMAKGDSPEFFSMLDDRCRIYYSLNKSHLDKLKIQNINVVYAFETIGMFWFLIVNRYLNIKPYKLCFGVYHPMEYFWESPQKSFIQKTIASIVNQIPFSNITFMNEGVLDRYNLYSHYDISKEQILPLPIDADRFKHTLRSPQKGRFVSVGRLVDFKTYNLHGLTTILALKNKGYKVQYDIYGSGELEAQMKQFVEKNGLQEIVHFHGPIPYKELEKAFEEAHCFIGCGTALLEASAAGLPCIVGIESIDSPLTSGYFSDTAGFNLGEFTEGMSLVEYLPLAEKILNMSDVEYDNLSKQHQKKANEFAIGNYTTKFMEKLQHSEITAPKYSAIKLLLWFVTYATLKTLSRIGINSTLTKRYVAHVKKDSE